ncbi:hypothetical protein JOE61_002946 [Nocardioides salarius]|uniref:DUF4386 family protein n=1 Tax=Nocardioides salarius TaxID=374513 RepID=A0ABS2MDD6_9ACTN|nr:hypothetical protein [Nocardioides salarius]MBM7509132.1 hypothetical protein [Nocardioides salarius]
MTATTSNPVRTDRGDLPRPGAAAPPPPRAWALTGVVAALAGAGAVVASSLVAAVYDPALAGDPERIAEAVGDKAPVIVAFHVLGLLGAVATVVFAAGLHRRLAARPGAGLAPAVAAAGLLGTALVTVLGTGLDTEFLFASQAGDGAADPHAVVFYNHWIGTIPWCWVLAGLAGVAVWRASRVGAVPTWIGRVGLVLGGLTLLLGISPLQYMAGMTGPVWLLVTAIGFAVGDRARRDGADA